ncbi:hypothetical protein [uncultured Hymenobacter sp.]|uniref:hypothetical protein n=1 Tax=uncultured Hymenobacter sp. TaxID=170016 RepID=UPI0035C9F121
MNQVEHIRGENESYDWANIIAHYEDLTTYGWGHEMLALVQYIVSSGVSTRLFAYTSHATLKVSIYKSRRSRQEELHIDFDSQEQVFYFDYYATEQVHGQPEFHRKYPVEAGIEKFDQFLRWMRW